MPDPNEQTTQQDSTTTETPTLEQLMAQLADAQKHIKTLNKENADRRKALEAFEKAEADRKAAEMTDLQKAQEELKKLAPELETLKAEKKALQLQASFEKAARSMKLEFANETAQEDAFRFLDAEIVGEDGAGMGKALEALQKSRPYLFGKVQPTTTDARNKGRTDGETDVAALLDAKRLQYGAI